MIYFCNDTATTEIYTYGHTLALHDALPSFPVCSPAQPGDATQAASAASNSAVVPRNLVSCTFLAPEKSDGLRHQHVMQFIAAVARRQQQAAQRLGIGILFQCATDLCLGIARQLQIGLDQRSEEHTSELQSLMRISYAVFCLK